MIRSILVGVSIALLAPAAVVAQDQDKTVTAPSQLAEIRRILWADNVDTSNLTTREVADTIARIPRGSAPDDFWAAYQAHVFAWERLADLVDDPEAEDDELAAAEEAVSTTFDEVERIARIYGARMPIPPAEQSSTV